MEQIQELKNNIKDKPAIGINFLGMMGTLEVLLSIFGFYALFCVSNRYMLIPGDYGILSLMILAVYLLLSSIISAVMAVVISGALVFKKNCSRSTAVFVLLISICLLILNFFIYKSV